MNNIKTLWPALLIGGLLSLTSCDKTKTSGEETLQNADGQTSDGKKVTVKGIVKNSLGPVVVMLEKRGQNTYIALDSTVTDSDGNFSFKVAVPDPNLYALNFMKEARHEIILNNTDITVEADVADIHKPKISVTGSPDTDFLSQYRTFQRNAFILLDSMKSGIPTAKDPKKAEADYEAQREKTLQDALKVSREMKNSIVVLAMLESGMIDLEGSYPTVDSIAKNLLALYPTSEMVKSFSSRMDAMKATAIGSTAADFTLNTMLDKPIQLSSFKGKYVLLDFWASWCKPCRAENPNVVKMYKKFKSPKFEILSVSIDKDAEAWKKAMAQDQMTWPSVFDNGDVARIYNVTYIPLTFLIDPNGIIIEKNLRGQELETKLAKILKGS